jgi:two-component system, LytTR family, sensor kinase
MTSGTAILSTPRSALETAEIDHAGPSRFWLLQAAGWSAYAVAMILSRFGIFPIRYMIASKGVLALTGLLCSLLLWRSYRWLLARNPSITRIVIASVILSYVVAALWTAIDNVTNIPIARALLGRQVSINSVFQLFVGSVYNAFTLLAWSLLYFGIKYYEALRVERERSLRAEAQAHRAQLEALRYQLHPHFLFNSLNAVSTLIVERRNDEASRMVSRLSDFLRLTLTGAVADEAPLADELEFVRRYLEIEQVRFGDRLVVSYDVAEDAWRVPVPHLVLQPLIENAIQHGIAQREEGGCLTISARRVAGKLRVEVVNDATAGHPAAHDDRERIGLANTRQRLRHLYGDEARLDVTAGPQSVQVVVEIPIRDARQA